MKLIYYIIPLLAIFVTTVACSSNLSAAFRKTISIEGVTFPSSGYHVKWKETDTHKFKIMVDDGRLLRKWKFKKRTKDTLKTGKSYINTIGMNFVWVPAGDFVMGRNGNSSEGPAHRVKIQKGFWIARTEVTQKHWQSLMGSNPARFRQALHPVEQINWDECQQFCKKLTHKEKICYQLPTEAQWEYACRAGKQSSSFFNISYTNAWHGGNTNGKTRPVGLSEPNAWGIYDMLGNVWEWCLDDYHSSFKGAPADGSAWINSKKRFKVRRGGCWRNAPFECNITTRAYYGPDKKYDSLGFRPVIVGKVAP